MEMEGEWGSRQRSPQAHPGRLSPPAFNGKGRREVWNIFICFVGFGKLKRNLPPVISAQLAKHFVILARSL